MATPHGMCAAVTPNGCCRIVPSAWSIATGASLLIAPRSRAAAHAGLLFPAASPAVSCLVEDEFAERFRLVTADAVSALLHLSATAGAWTTVQCGRRGRQRGMGQGEQAGAGAAVHEASTGVWCVSRLCRLKKRRRGLRPRNRQHLGDPSAQRCHVPAPSPRRRRDEAPPHGNSAMGAQNPDRLHARRQRGTRRSSGPGHAKGRANRPQSLPLNRINDWLEESTARVPALSTLGDCACVGPDPQQSLASSPVMTASQSPHGSQQAPGARSNTRAPFRAVPGTGRDAPPAPPTPACGNPAVVCTTVTCSRGTSSGTRSGTT